MKFLGFMIAGLMLPLAALAYDDGPCNLYQVVCLPELTTVEVRAMSSGTCAYGHHPFSEQELASLRKQNIQLLNKYITPEDISCTILGRTIRVVGKATIEKYDQPTLLLSIWDDAHKVAEDIPFFRAKRQGEYRYWWRLKTAEYSVSKYKYGGLNLFGTHHENTLRTTGYVYEGLGVYEEGKEFNGVPQRSIIRGEDIPWRGWNPPDVK